MKEAEIDVFEHLVEFDGLCITTNGDFSKSGLAVMGRGVALLAKQRWPDIAYRLGERLQEFGNVVGVIGHYEGVRIFSFPTKHHWRDRKSDLKLIETSARQLAAQLVASGLKRVALPRPGTENGFLAWEKVRPVIEPILGDNVVVVSLGQT